MQRENKKLLSTSCVVRVLLQRIGRNVKKLKSKRKVYKKKIQPQKMKTKNPKIWIQKSDV